MVHLHLPITQVEIDNQILVFQKKKSGIVFLTWQHRIQIQYGVG